MDSAIAVNADIRPSPGFALKEGGAKKVTFTKEQKDIMAAFYENQRTSRIRANPADVIEAMKAAGVPPLKESQIKSWWSTYHRNGRQIAEDLMMEARHLRPQREGAVHTNHLLFCKDNVYISSFSFFIIVRVLKGKSHLFLLTCTVYVL